MRAVFGVFAALVATITTLAVNPAGAAKPKEVQHCTLEIVGTNDDGSWKTGPLECASGPLVIDSSRSVSALGGYIAVHYDGYNLSGAALGISGASCNGGWLNLPAAWQDRVASTQSDCVVSHYRDYFLSGTVNTTYSPGGNLWTAADAVSSVRYG